MSHSKDQFVLFVPYWVAKVLDREKINYNKLLELSELRKYFSTEEISILYWLNKDHPLFTDSMSSMSDDPMLYGVWGGYGEDAEYVSNRLVPMEGIAKQAIQARLTNGVDLVQDGIDCFRIVTLSESKLFFIVIVYPGMDAVQLTTLSAALLKLLYAHTGYDDMARNHLFKSYIERLALANNAL